MLVSITTASYILRYVPEPMLVSKISGIIHEVVSCRIMRNTDRRFSFENSEYDVREEGICILSRKSWAFGCRHFGPYWTQEGSGCDLHDLGPEMPMAMGA